MNQIFSFDLVMCIKKSVSVNITLDSQKSLEDDKMHYILSVLDCFPSFSLEEKLSSIIFSWTKHCSNIHDIVSLIKNILVPPERYMWFRLYIVYMHYIPNIVDKFMSLV